MRVQILKITTPDDMEKPDRLIKTALERYLDHDDMWREVKVEVIADTTEEPLRTVFG